MEDYEFARALSHPLRIDILLALGDKTRSPSELVPYLDDAPLTLVSYHMRKLNEFGVVKLVHTRTRRGAVEHFYKRDMAVLRQGQRSLARLF